MFHALKIGWCHVAALLLVSMTLPQAAHAAQAVATSADETPALALAKLIYPKEALPAFRADFPSHFAAGVRTNPQFASLEKLFPGFTQRYAKAAIGEVQRIAVARLPILHRDLEKMLAADFSGAEIGQALAFYESAAGQALRASLIKNVDVKGLAQSFASGGSLTTTELNQHMAIAGMSASLEMSEEHKSTMQAFGRSSAGQKLAEFEMTKLAPAVLAWQASTPKEDIRKLDAIALDVMKAMRK